MEVLCQFDFVELSEAELLEIDGGGIWYDLGYALYNWIQSLPEQLEELKEVLQLPGPDSYPRGDVRGSDWYKEVTGANQ